MKRTLTIIIFTLMLFILSACNNNSDKKVTITASELTDREEKLLLINTEQSFVFDFDIKKGYKDVTVWIEKYESGNLKEETIVDLVSQIEGNGSIIITTSKKNYNQTIFNIAINDKKGFVSTNAIDANSIDLDDMSNISGKSSEEIILIDGEVVLGAICYSNDTKIISLTNDFYQNVDSHINEIERYEIVYLIKAKFSK